MANSLTSNVTRQLARVFLDKFEASRVLTKSVDTQLLGGKLNRRSGTTVDFKRPHDYNAHRSSDGDISSNKNDIVSGKATGTVQNYFTVAAEWSDLEDALQMDQLDQILAPMATRIVTDLELDLCSFMQKNLGLSYGTMGTAIDAWTDVAGAAAHMESIGVPMDDVYYVMNPHVGAGLANVQASLSSGSNDLVDNAWERSQLSGNMGGFRVMTSNALKTRTSSTLTDRAGAVNGTMDVSYATHKDGMIQSIVVDGFTSTTTVKAGEIVEVTGLNQLSLATREPVLNAAGAAVLWRGVVTADASLTSGAGTLLVAGPAIYESGGQYNTTEAALADNDVITILGASATNYQPAMMYHKQAVGLGTVKLNKLYATDTIATTEDGISIRVTKYSDGDTNTQKVRFDLLPAYACFNPYFGGQAFGV